MNAVYARQSVDKKDSISIESQIKSCASDMDGEPYRVYCDRGFSGKNTDRPQFKRLTEDIKAGGINRVYVYRIDRISRAITDFGTIMELFEKHNVEFISHTEKFDTSSPIGKAMLNIIMVFAQLERETIQQRITDNYYSRGEKGFYLGGCPPFGYGKKEIWKNGKRTYSYEKIPSEANFVEEIYSLYSSGNMSMNSIARILNERGISTRRKRPWTQGSVSRILKSCAYVRADAQVYEYLKKSGAHMNNPVNDYTGVNGCIAYGSENGRYVTLGSYEGIVAADMWLDVQQKRKNNQNHSNIGTGTLSWLQGRVKCRLCGCSCYVKKYKTGQRYFYCRGKKNGSCIGQKKMIRCDRAEKAAEEVILNRLNHLDGTELSQEINPEINRLKIELAQTDEKIDNVMKFMYSADGAARGYINDELKRLDAVKNEIYNRIEAAYGRQQCQNVFDSGKLVDLWETGDTDVKKDIAAAVLDRIEADGNELDIYCSI